MCLLLLLPVFARLNKVLFRQNLSSKCCRNWRVLRHCFPWFLRQKKRPYPHTVELTRKKLELHFPDATSLFYFLCADISIFVAAHSQWWTFTDGSDLIIMIGLLWFVRPSSLVGGSSKTLIPHYKTSSKGKGSPYTVERRLSELIWTSDRSYNRT